MKKTYTRKREHLQEVPKQTGEPVLKDFLSELARLELAIIGTSNSRSVLPGEVNQISINPTLQLLRLSYKNLVSALENKGTFSYKPERGEEMILVWKDPKTGKTKYRQALNDDLLALKILADDIDPLTAAEEARAAVGLFDAAIDRAVYDGLLLSPKSLIMRDTSAYQCSEDIEECYLSSYSFTLQWHITQACDLHCKHCYDRTARSSITLEQGIRILDDLRTFCRSRHVMGAVSFTGGNPLLYPHFTELYQAASDRGFVISVLGNPCTHEKIEELLSIQKLSHFQVSLEGLSEHNDFIRGSGHFERVTEFLYTLRRLHVFSMVMLTLTRDNMKQVIPLAGILQGIADRFHFNRLSLVGEGANLAPPDKNGYAAFLESYLDAAEKNRVMGLKDNLINIIRYRNGDRLFGGCSGYGCGAAFNFLSVLPDGQVHACRKFPSPVGNIFQQSLSEIYDSENAQRYRSGCKACSTCPIRPVCGGCLASAYSHGLNIFEDKDPFCFINQS